MILIRNNKFDDSNFQTKNYSCFNQREFFVGKNIREQLKVACFTRLYSWTAPYINDLPQSLAEAGSYLYADGTCIFCQHEDVEKIENILNKEFSSLYRLFIDKKSPIWGR